MLPPKYIKTVRDEQMTLAIYILTAYVLLSLCGIGTLLTIPVLKILCPLLILGAIGAIVYLTMELFNLGPFKDQDNEEEA